MLPLLLQTLQNGSGRHDPGASLKIIQMAAAVEKIISSSLRRVWQTWLSLSPWFHNVPNSEIFHTFVSWCLQKNAPWSSHWKSDGWMLANMIINLCCVNSSHTIFSKYSGSSWLDWEVPKLDSQPMGHDPLADWMTDYSQGSPKTMLHIQYLH